MKTYLSKKFDPQLPRAQVGLTRYIRFSQRAKIFVVFALMLMTIFSQTSSGQCDGEIPKRLQGVAEDMAALTHQDVTSHNGDIPFPDMEAAWNSLNPVPDVKFMHKDTLNAMADAYVGKLTDKGVSDADAAVARGIYFELLKLKRAGYFPEC